MSTLDFRATKFFRVPKEVFKFSELGLSSTDFVIYCYICNKVNNKSKSCVISARYISDDLGLSQRTVSRSISSLRDSGVIKVRNRFRSDGGRASNEITLLTF